MTHHLRTHGFTLLELIAVIAIVAILAAVLFPVLASAKQSAKVVGSKQYLRQQFIAIELYAQNSDGVLPPWLAMQADKQLQVPCSPMDHWIMPCWSRKAPMVGSYGYVAAIAGRSLAAVNTDQAYPLLADVFSGNYRLGEFSGPTFPSYPACLLKGTCEFPDRIWFTYTDGSLRVQKNPLRMPFQPGMRELFSWPAAFNRQIKADRRDGSG